MKIEKAIETMKYNKHLLGLTEQGETWKECANTIACDMAIEELKKQLNGGWISVSERPPECEEEVLILTERNTITTAMYEDGKMPEEDSVWNWNEVDFDYDEENDIYYVPEGWWEYRHFNPDDVYNNAIDEKVIAWQPKPKPYKED